MDGITRMQGYLISLDVIDRQKEGGAQAPSQIKAAEESSRQALDRLLNMGISPSQLEEIRHTRETSTDLVITASAAGIVVFGQDARYIRPGQRARVTLAAGGAGLSAKVSDILPQFDPSSRTYKVRLEMDNPGCALRPDMFVDVQLAIELPASVSVPVDAVLDSGLSEEGNAGERIVTSANFLLDSETRLQQAAAARTGGAN
jgi:multidrug efflux pump subunit AcrA (membrane-fusion protein)